jgi:Protein of unknown function (DUF3551)
MLSLSFLKIGAPTTLAVAAIVGAMGTGSAKAAEFCRQDVTGHMTSCSYPSMEQCKAMSEGIGGDCFRDPWLGNSNASSNPGGNPSGAFAYAPKAPQAAKGGRRGNATSRGN